MIATLLALLSPALGQDLPHQTVYVEDVPATITITEPSHIVTDERMRLILEKLKSGERCYTKLETCADECIIEITSVRSALEICRDSRYEDSQLIEELRESMAASDIARRRAISQRNVIVALGTGAVTGVGLLAFFATR